MSAYDHILDLLALHAGMLWLRFGEACSEEAFVGRDCRMYMSEYDKKTILTPTLFHIDVVDPVCEQIKERPRHV